MAMHAIPTKTDAANEKIFRCDIIAFLSLHDCQKRRIPRLPDWMILEQVAPASRNLAASVTPRVIASLI
jgi:hypothetical protein